MNVTSDEVLEIQAREHHLAGNLHLTKKCACAIADPKHRDETLQLLGLFIVRSH